MIIIGPVNGVTAMRTELVTILKRRATELLAELEKAGAPILIAQHGLPSACLADVESYEKLQRCVALLEGVARGERAVGEKRVMTHARARARMARWLE